MNEDSIDDTKPFTVNGILFKNRKEYEERLNDDAQKLAVLLYDIYKEKKQQAKTNDYNTET